MHHFSFSTSLGRLRPNLGTHRQSTYKHEIPEHHPLSSITSSPHRQHISQNSKIHWPNPQPTCHCSHRLRQLPQHSPTLHFSPPSPTHYIKPTLINDGRKWCLHTIARYISLSGHLSTNFYIHHSFIPFTIEGANVVLGIEWMRILGLIQVDFFIPNIAFTHQNQQITIQVTTTSTPTSTTYHQFCQYLFTNSIASLHLLSTDNTPIPPTSLEFDLHNPSSPLCSLPFPIQSILLQNQTIFQKP